MNVYPSASSLIRLYPRQSPARSMQLHLPDAPCWSGPSKSYTSAYSCYAATKLYDIYAASWNASRTLRQGSLPYLAFPLNSAPWHLPLITQSAQQDSFCEYNKGSRWMYMVTLWCESDRVPEPKCHGVRFVCLLSRPACTCLGVSSAWIFAQRTPCCWLSLNYLPPPPFPSSSPFLSVCLRVFCDRKLTFCRRLAWQSILEAARKTEWAYLDLLQRTILGLLKVIRLSWLVLLWYILMHVCSSGLNLSWHDDHHQQVHNQWLQVDDFHPLIFEEVC